MSYDIDSFLCNYLQTTHFSIRLDDFTVSGTILVAKVRFAMDQEFHEELLFVRTLTTDTKGESILNVSRDYFMEKGILLADILSVAGCRAPAIVDL